MWNASRFCVSSLRRGHANLLCIVPILVYVLPKQVQGFVCLWPPFDLTGPIVHTRTITPVNIVLASAVHILKLERYRED